MINNNMVNDYEVSDYAYVFDGDVYADLDEIIELIKEEMVKDGLSDKAIDMVLDDAQMALELLLPDESYTIWDYDVVMICD